jgi:hypothetical protein
MKDRSRSDALKGENGSEPYFAKCDAESVAESADGRQAPLYVAIVHSPDAIRFTAVATSEDELIEPLARFVRSQAAERLWPDDALAVERRAASGDLKGAIQTYFESVGSRWDPEILHIATADLATPSALTRAS